MADMRAAIVEMMRQGMDRQAILENLNDLGIGNAEEIYNAAESQYEASQGGAPAGYEQAPAQGKPIIPATAPSSPEQEGLSPPEILAAANLGQAGASARIPAGLEEKLDETIALLKALKELNTQILEANRDILLRLKQ